MAYADFTYYQEVFKGSAITDGKVFASLSEKATDYINAMTFNRIKKDITDGVRRCCCALAEQINIDNTHQSGKLISSEKNGNYSVSYAVPSIVATEHYRKMRTICNQYLGHTGLMFRGVYYDN
jgi:hypothetical protein